MVDARDVGAVAAQVLAGAPAGQARDVTGPEALGHAEAASKLAASPSAARSGTFRSTTTTARSGHAGRGRGRMAR